MAMAHYLVMHSCCQASLGDEVVALGKENASRKGAVSAGGFSGAGDTSSEMVGHASVASFGRGPLKRNHTDMMSAASSEALCSPLRRLSAPPSSRHTSDFARLDGTASSPAQSSVGVLDQLPSEAMSILHSLPSDCQQSVRFEGLTSSPPARSQDDLVCTEEMSSDEAPTLPAGTAAVAIPEVTVSSLLPEPLAPTAAPATSAIAAVSAVPEATAQRSASIAEAKRRAYGSAPPDVSQVDPVPRTDDEVQLLAALPADCDSVLRAVCLMLAREAAAAAAAAAGSAKRAKVSITHQ